jgi:hypothetical protein
MTTLKATESEAVRLNLRIVRGGRQYAKSIVANEVTFARINTRNRGVITPIFFAMKLPPD